MFIKVLKSYGGLGVLKTEIFILYFMLISYMGQALDFVRTLYTEFSELESLLQKVIKDEGSLENSILIKKGFLIKRYSIREDRIDIDLLRQIRAELRKCLGIELRVTSQVNAARSVILSIEQDYNAYKGGNLSFWRVFQQDMKNAFRMSRLAVVRFDELISMVTLNLPNVVAFIVQETGLGDPEKPTVPMYWLLFKMFHSLGAFIVTLTLAAADVRALIVVFITKSLYWNASFGVKI